MLHVRNSIAKGMVVLTIFDIPSWKAPIPFNKTVINEESKILTVEDSKYIGSLIWVPKNCRSEAM